MSEKKYPETIELAKYATISDETTDFHGTAHLNEAESEPEGKQ